MKRSFILLFFACSVSLYSQTWTEREIETGLNRECTVITKEQFDRILRQYEEDHGASQFFYYDILELGSGARPELIGTYYLLIRRRTFSGIAPALAYGNSNTGRMEIWFDRFFDVKVDTIEYRQRFDQLVKRVKGD